MDTVIRAFCFALLLLVAGCATSATSTPRPFNFQTDTFSYSNQLVWEYRLDPSTGKAITSKREPPPTYTHHCFVMVRAARQFFDHAQFDPSVPRATNYAPFVRKVIARSPRESSSDDDEKIVIPGYANLREFSRDHTELLQRKSGGAWQSYFQRGHWRMILPLTRGHQERTVERLLEDLQQNRPAIVHIVRFPSLAINHALLIYAAEEADQQIRFLAYDANNAETPVPLTYHRRERRFTLPPNSYFPRGGRVDVYRIFTGLLY